MALVRKTWWRRAISYILSIARGEKDPARHCVTDHTGCCTPTHSKCMHQAEKPKQIRTDKLLPGMKYYWSEHAVRVLTSYAKDTVTPYIIHKISTDGKGIIRLDPTTPSGLQYTDVEWLVVPDSFYNRMIIWRHRFSVFRQFRKWDKLPEPSRFGIFLLVLTISGMVEILCGIQHMVLLVAVTAALTRILSNMWVDLKVSERFLTIVAIISFALIAAMWTAVLHAHFSFLSRINP